MISIICLVIGLAVAGAGHRGWETDNLQPSGMVILGVVTAVLAVVVFMGRDWLSVYVGFFLLAQGAVLGTIGLTAGDEAHKKTKGDHNKGEDD